MPLVGRLVPVEPDPMRLARKLADEPGCSFLWTASGAGPAYLACWPVDTVRSIDPEPGLRLVPRANELSRLPRWIGLVPYEARRDLERRAWASGPDRRAATPATTAIWQRYGAVVKVTDKVVVGGDDPVLVDKLSRRLLTAAVRPEPVHAELVSLEADDVHRRRIVHALEWIRRGHVYQINLARRFDFELRGRSVDALGVLARHAPSSFAAALELGDYCVIASSPELFLDLRADGWMRTVPIKGTRPRGRDAVEDTRLMTDLEQDPKERAELSMVVDVERNDLGKVAEVGSVVVPLSPQVVTHRTIHHRQAHVVGKLAAHATRRDLLLAASPSGSVTGAPKIRAMELIAELESARRGVYTGGYGFIRHDGGMRLAMAIRTVVRQGAQAHYFSGGGIVADSDPDREVVETRWKALQILRLLDESHRTGALPAGGAAP